jgi:hypothetical protein
MHVILQIRTEHRPFSPEVVREATCEEYLRLLKVRNRALFQKLMDYPGRVSQNALG